MTMQPPPPPSITPRQMDLLRVVASMAWSDGELAEAEVTLMLDRLSRVFAQDERQRTQLRQELQDYLLQSIPLEELIPKLKTQAERELVLKLGYEVIQCSSRTPDEPNINPAEATAYQRLVQLLDLPAAVVQRLEAEATADLKQETGIVDTVARQFEAFIQGQ